MDLFQRLRSIDDRLYTIETVSRLRSAAISEGVTEFVEDGELVVADGGSFIISDGGAISGGSWELGVNDDGSTYANVGDVLVYTGEADPVAEYIDLESIPATLDSPITRVEQQIPEDASYAIVVGTLTIMAEDDIRSIVRVRSEDTDISMVVLEGQTQSIPLIMKFEGVIKFEIHTPQSFDVDLSLEAIYQREV